MKARILFDKRRSWSSLGASWVWKLLYGSGAGYIGGFTLYIAYKSGSLRWAKQFRGTEQNVPKCYRSPWDWIKLGPFEFGITKNANIVPWINH